MNPEDWEMGTHHMLEYTAGALLSLSICEGSVTRSWLIEKPLLTLLSLLPNYLISCDSGGFSWTKQASSHRFLAGFGQQINTGCARCSWNVYDAHGGGLMRFFGWATIKHMYILYNWYYTIDIIWYYIYIYYILHITYIIVDYVLEMTHHISSYLTHSI